MNKPITKFYNSDDVNTTTAELRQVTVEIRFKRLTLKLDVFLWVSVKCIKDKFLLIPLTQPARDVSGTSPEGPVKVLMSGTSRGSSGDSLWTNKKIDYLIQKSVF